MTRNKLNKFDYLLHVNVSLNQKTVTLYFSTQFCQESRAQKSFDDSVSECENWKFNGGLRAPSHSFQPQRNFMWLNQMCGSKRVKNLMGVYCYIHDGFYSIFSESLKCFLFFNHEVDSIVHSTITSPKCISIADSLLRAFVFTSFDFFFFLNE